MTKILKKGNRKFEENANKIDHFRIFSDTSRINNKIEPENLNFDLRQLNPGQFSAPFHFHRYAEELFMVISGSMILRTFDELEIVETGDLIFCEKGKYGAHQLHNHTNEPCIYLDIRTFTGQDICEYPDSEKILLAPSFEIFSNKSGTGYFDGEENILEKWNDLRRSQNKNI